jgi:hypothetical protein
MRRHQRRSLQRRPRAGPTSGPPPPGVGRRAGPGHFSSPRTHQGRRRLLARAVPAWCAGLVPHPCGARRCAVLPPGRQHRRAGCRGERSADSCARRSAVPRCRLRRPAAAASASGCLPVQAASADAACAAPGQARAPDLGRAPAAGAVGLGASAAILLQRGRAPVAPAAGEEDADGDDQLLVNWSGTHECRPCALAQPESLEELEAVVAHAHEQGAPSPWTSSCVRALAPGCGGLCSCSATVNKLLRVHALALGPWGLMQPLDGALSCSRLGRGGPVGEAGLRAACGPRRAGREPRRMASRPPPKRQAPKLRPGRRAPRPRAGRKLRCVGQSGARPHRPDAALRG